MDLSISDRAQAFIYLLHTDCGASDKEIAQYCNVTRQHINRVKCDHARASQELCNQLERLYNQLDASKEPPPRKHYTWQTGQDTRARAVRRSLPRRQEHRGQRDTSARRPPITTEPAPIMPTLPYTPAPAWRTFTGVEDM